MPEYTHTTLFTYPGADMWLREDGSAYVAVDDPYYSGDLTPEQVREMYEKLQAHFEVETVMPSLTEEQKQVFSTFGTHGKEFGWEAADTLRLIQPFEGVLWESRIGSIPQSMIAYLTPLGRRLVHKLKAPSPNNSRTT